MSFDGREYNEWRAHQLDLQREREEKFHDDFNAQVERQYQRDHANNSSGGPLLAGFIGGIVAAAFSFLFRKSRNSQYQVYSGNMDVNQENNQDNFKEPELPKPYRNKQRSDVRKRQRSRKWYDVLGILPDSDKDTITAAFHKRMNECHPDHVAGLSSKLKSLAAKEARAINEAYEQALDFVSHQEQRLERLQSSSPIVIYNEPLSDETSLQKILSDADAWSDLELSIETARTDNEVLQNVLLISSSQKIGSTFARLIARGLGVRCLGIAAAELRSEGDLAILLTNLQDRDVLFIENLETLDANLAEVLRISIDEFRFTVHVATAAKDVHIDLERFTLVASVVEDNVLSRPLSEAFKIRVH